MNKRKQSRTLRWLAPCSTLLPLHAAMAQAAAPAPAPAATSISATATAAAAAAATGTTIETVIVTAEKRSGDLQKTPVAVTAISGAQLDKSNIFDVSALNGTVPGLSIAKSAGFERVVTIRGIGSETPENSYATQPGVALHVDGVYIANSISLDQSLFDLERLEVLRGPQGTLFGQSSTGGTINLVTKQPVLKELSGSGDVSIGNYNLHRERGEINVPLGSEFALRASLQQYAHDGFAKSNVTGYRLDDANDHSGKIALLWKPDPDLKATLTAQSYQADQHGAAQKSIADPDPNPRSLTQDYPSKFKLNADLFYANVEWALPQATFKSVTSYQKLHHQQQADADRVSYSVLHQADDSESYDYDDIAAWTTRLKNYTQEFNLSSKPGGAVDWIVGAFGMKQTSGQYVLEYSGLGDNQVLSQPADIETNPPDNLEFGEDTTAHRTSWAAFFQSTYHASDRLRLTVGARTNHDQYHADIGTFSGANFTGGAGAKSLTVNSQSYSDSKPTGKLEADFDLTDDSMVYASVTRGYKPGGINSNSTPVVVAHTFKPESVTSFELGSKNKFLDNTLRLNVAGFYYKYNDMQYLEVDPVPYNYGTANIPKMQMWGGEIEASYLTMGSRLRLNGNLTAMGGRFDGNYKAIDATTVQNVYASNANCAYGGQYYNTACWAAVEDAAGSLKGNKPAKMPSLQGSANASYTAPLAGGQLMSRAEVVYRGSFFYRVFNDSSLDRVPSYTIFNLHFEYQPEDSPWTYSLTGSNLANRAGVNSRFTDPYGRGATSQEYIAPRQVVGTVAYAF
jgi:iron complex outermembrane receptor protein